MTTYADLLYEAAETLDAAAQMVRSLDHDGMVEDYPSELRADAEKIREALRTSPAHPALSTEDVERIKKYYDPSGSLYRDIEALSQSHEALRREKDTATSIAERFQAGWVPARDLKQPVAGDVQWWNQNIGIDAKDEPMTQDQIDWFEARK